LDDVLAGRHSGSSSSTSTDAASRNELEIQSAPSVSFQLAENLAFERLMNPTIPHSYTSQW
jgi:hypothetical protein